MELGMGPILTTIYQVLPCFANDTQHKNSSIQFGHEGIAHTLGQIWCKIILVDRFGENFPITNPWPSTIDAKLKTKDAP